MIGLERVKIIERDGSLFIKTILGYITLEAMIGLDCLDDCLILAKTCDDLLKPFKQVILIHLRGHKASDEIIKKYEESQGLNGEILKEVIKQLQKEPEKLQEIRNSKGVVAFQLSQFAVAT